MDDDYRDDDYRDDDDASDDDDVGGGSSSQPSTGSSSSGSGPRPSDDDDDDDYSGSGDDDDYRPSGALGFVDDDYIRKLLQDDDYIGGTRFKRDDIDDDYRGLLSSGSRLFEGTNDADDIIGRRMGRSVDLMVGRRGDDNFILGSARSAFYARDRRDGDASFALIKDFSRKQEDTVFLNGSRRDYGLSRMKVDGERGLGLMLEGRGSRPDNLIALIQGRGANGLKLGDSSSFGFID